MRRILLGAAMVAALAFGGVGESGQRSESGGDQH